MTVAATGSESVRTNCRRFRPVGFTIVELLIVIVVVGILAAITVVAYTSISSSARASAAKAGLTQAAKKLDIYKVQNGGQYPATLADAGIANSAGTTFQYTVNNSVSPPTYCVTATVGDVSYKGTESVAPSSGGCPGHGQGGQSAITNLATNPSVESNSSGWTQNWGTSGNGTATRLTTGGHDGSAYFRTTWSTAPTVTWGGHTYNFITAGTVGASYSASVWVRSSSTHPLYVCIRTNNWSSGGAQACGAATSVPPNTWTRLAVTLPSYSAGSTSFHSYVGRSGAGSWQAGDVLDTDGLIIVQGPTAPNFADGNSPNWVWNGTANNSTSTGPEQ